MVDDPTLDWTEQLASQLDWHWTNQARPRLDGLTDAEYFWEPVPGCWSLRPREEATTPFPEGPGPLTADIEFPEPDPVPVTTIAWRLGHLLVGVFGTRVASHFAGPPVTYQDVVWPTTAVEALARLDAVYDRWIMGVSGLDTEALARPCGPAEGAFAQFPFAGLVLHINREAIHHLAEIALLRDLYTATQGDELGP